MSCRNHKNGINYVKVHCGMKFTINAREGGGGGAGREFRELLARGKRSVSHHLNKT